MSAPRIEIVIDELALRGMPEADAAAVARALELRLGELGATWSGERAALPAACDEAFRRARPAAAASPDPAAIGGAVADRVFATVTEGRR